MLSLLKLGLSEYAENHVFGSLSLNNSEIFRLSFEDIFLGTLDTTTKKMNPPSAVLGAGVHGKVCWLIAYCYTLLVFDFEFTALSWSATFGFYIFSKFKRVAGGQGILTLSTYQYNTILYKHVFTY